QITALHVIKFEVTDLSGSYLGEADGNRILVDRNAEGKGWFVDPTPQDDSEFGNVSSTTRRYTDPNGAPAGHVDLLTAIEHEIGHKLGLDDSYAEKDRDSIMYGYLTVGERRLPAPGQAKNAQPNALTGWHFLTLGDGRRKADDRQQTAMSKPQSNERKANHASRVRAAAVSKPVTPMSGETVSTTIGTLHQGDSAQITFQVVVNDPYTGGPNVSNQGTVSGSNFSNVLTDDPAVGGTADPTLTPINTPPAISAQDATAFEPTSGMAPMIFTVTLDKPAPVTGVMVNYATADDSGGAHPATGGGACNGTTVDYITQSGTVSFASGEQVKTVSVNICADTPEGFDETLLLNLSGAV